MNPEVIKVTKKFKSQVVELTRKHFGDEGANLINLMYSQKAQAELIEIMLDLAMTYPTADDKEEVEKLLNNYIDVYTNVQSHITQYAVDLSKISEDKATQIFDMANDAFEKINAQLKAPDGKND